MSSVKKLAAQASSRDKKAAKEENTLEKKSSGIYFISSDKTQFKQEQHMQLLVLVFTTLDSKKLDLL